MNPEMPTPTESTDLEDSGLSQLEDSQTEDSGINLSVKRGADPTLMTEYQFIVDLLNRQDEVLAGLDELNERVLATIEEINTQRQLENQPETDTKNLESEDGLKKAA